MVMTTSGRYRGLQYASYEPRSSAGRNAVVHARNSVGAQRISGPSRGTFNNNSMLKAIKAVTSAATSKPTVETSQNQKHLQPQSQARIRSPALNRTKTLASLERSNNEGRQPSTWDEMLSARTKPSSNHSDVLPTLKCNTSSLQQFDPHRTLAFLVTELNSKLKTSLPGDNTVHRILDEVRCTLKRIGNASQSSRAADVTSDTNLMQPNCMKCSNSFDKTDKHCSLYYEKSVQTERERSPPCKTTKRNSVPTSSRREKTPPSSPENIPSTRKRSDSPKSKSESPKKLTTAGKELKASKEKSKERYKAAAGDSERNELKKAIKSKIERSSFEAELEMYKQEIDELKAKVACLEQRLEAANIREAHLIQELEGQCKVLQHELKTLQDIVQKQTNELSVVQELSAKLKQSAMKINLLEKSKLEADRILVFTKIEKEKLATLQKFQENQVSVLQSEVNQLISVVRDQVEDIHRSTSKPRAKSNTEKPPKPKVHDKQLLKPPPLSLEDPRSSKDDPLQENVLNSSERNRSLEQHKPHYTRTTKRRQSLSSFDYSQNKYDCSSANEICPGSTEKRRMVARHYEESLLVQQDDPRDAHEKSERKKHMIMKPKKLTYETESTYLIGKNKTPEKDPPSKFPGSKADCSKLNKRDSSQEKSAYLQLSSRHENSIVKVQASPISKSANKRDDGERSKSQKRVDEDEDEEEERYKSGSNAGCYACQRPFRCAAGQDSPQKKEPIFSCHIKQKTRTCDLRKPPPAPLIISYHQPSLQPPQPPSYSTPSSDRPAHMHKPTRYILKEHHQSKDNTSHMTSGMESS